MPRQNPRAELAPAADAGALRDELAELLQRYEAEKRADPFSNPILRLALELSRRLRDGKLDADALEALIQRLTMRGFARRAERLSRYLGDVDPEADAARLAALFRRLADEGAAPFDAFKARLEEEVFGVVVTAHPTFSLSGELMAILASLASGREADGTPLTAERRAALLADAAAQEHRPDRELTLNREHELSVVAIANVQNALRRVYGAALDVARELYPERWTELTPRLLTVASWVGYDLDGRSDIRWSDTLEKRLRVGHLQLQRYLAEARALQRAAASDDLRVTLELLESRIALAVAQSADEADILAGGAPSASEAEDAARFRALNRRMFESLPTRLRDAGPLIALIDRALRQTEDDALRRRLCALRAEMATHGIGLAHAHVRINATQIHNAIRKSVGMETAPDDPRYSRSYLAALNELLDDVRPAQVNFGSIMAERTSAKRLFMIVAAMLKYADAATPARFLIAECESAFTVLAALYYAKLFGVEDRIDISPLFETQRGLEAGSRILGQLLENPHFRAYVEKRGRLCVQTGYSDAGRFIGQIPAAASIERLRLRIIRLFARHGLQDKVQLVIFDTHGESAGRGGHPGGLGQRLAYAATPYSLAFMASRDIRFKQEASFQGGDGFQLFATPDLAFAVVTRALEHMLAPPETEIDPFYDENDYITEIFTIIVEYQKDLMEDPDYAALLGAFGANFLYPSGSRAAKRQRTAMDGEAEYGHPSRTRAIPHNARLLQLAFPANVVGGVGAAIDRDPDRFAALYAASPRLRQLMGMAEFGAAVTNVDALKAYVEALDPDIWLSRSAAATARPRKEALRRVSGMLEEHALHDRQARVFRKLHRDFLTLEEDLERLRPAAHSGCDRLLDGEARRDLALLHAVRVALIQEIFILATHIPDFSSQHGITLSRLIGRVLHLEIPEVVRLLEDIFPARGAELSAGDFGEPATYASEESQNYVLENERIFKPLLRLYELVRRVSSGVTHHVGFLG